MTWKFSSDRPVYLQIMDQIRGAVITGEFSPGSKIPSVRDMAMEARVNPNTMQHALQELEQEKLLTAHGTNGRFVTDDPQILEDIRLRCLQALAAECAEKFALFGVSPREAAGIMEKMEQ